ncbi:MAG: hypothetical protein V3S04_01070 [Candidatus Omnitrophota bacterium]
MLLVHSSQIPDDYLCKLDELIPGLERVALPESIDVYPSISSHPDIFFCQLMSKTLISSPRIEEALLLDLKRSGVDIIISKRPPFGRYPGTASLNAACVGKNLIHKQDITDPAIKNAAKARGFRLIDCDQGYARCSTVPVKESALITSDVGIQEAAKETGIKTLLIRPGHVALPGEAYGFIGGASGILPDDSVIFLGDIRLHPDFSAIERFLADHKTGYSYLAGLPLYDSGSLIFIN